MFKRRLLATLALSVVSTGVFGLANSTPASAASVEIQILGINDFHGRLEAASEPGAAKLAGVVDALRSGVTNTVFAAAGDLVGATTFTSFIAKDKPTIDVLNEMGLDVSATGNHEFDQGYDDLVNRIMDPLDPEGGAAWTYLAANVQEPVDNIDETWIRDFGTVQVGFIGAVTDALPELVSPAGIAGLTIEEPVVAANREAANLKAAGADIIVLLVHEGAETTELSSAIDPTTEFGQIVTQASPDIDAIISGHTHLPYNHSIPVPDWADETVKNRPVVSAGQYGFNVNQLVFTIDDATGELLNIEQNIVDVAAHAATPDTDVQAIVDAAVTNAETLGAQVLGKIAGPFYRARVDGEATGSSRGAESTIGNIVAEAQRWATEAEEFGGAEIAFMNPGGLRDDMIGVGPGFPTDLTYKQAANVQPFANTLVNLQMTGAEIKMALEQQWQPEGASRPELKLGTSNGFRYTFDPTAPEGARITGMWLNDAPISLTESYSVTVNSFLAAGGDNFTAFALPTERRDTGQVDLAAMVAFMAQYNATPLEVDYSGHSAGITFDALTDYGPGDHLQFEVSAWSMTGPDDLVDTEIEVRANGRLLGTVPVDNSLSADPLDVNGTASVDLMLPDDFTGSVYPITLTGVTTGTEAIVQPDGFAPVAPTRLLDTRAGSTTSDGQQAGDGPLGPGQTVKVTIDGRANLPAGQVGAVALNLTALNATAPTFLTAFPGGTLPTASNVNLLPGGVVPNVVIVPVGDDGTVSIFNQFGNVDLVVDLLGWVPAGNAFAGLAPARLVDTRPGEHTVDDQQAGGGALAAEGEIEVQVAGRGGVPATGAGAVLVNVTGTEATQPTFFTIYPTGTGRPLASNLNVLPGDVRPNMVLVPLGDDGKITVFNQFGSAHVIIDVLGWVPEGSAFNGLDPARLVDTRPGSTTVDNDQAGIGVVGPAGEITINVANRGGVPATGAAGAVFNVTYVNGTAPSFLTLYPGGTTRPLASNVNVLPGDVRSNLVIVPIGADGTVKLFNQFGTVDVVVDVLGWIPA